MLGARSVVEARDVGLDYFLRRPKRMRRVTYNRPRARALAKLNRYHTMLDRGLWRVFARLSPDELAELCGDDIRPAG